MRLDQRLVSLSLAPSRAKARAAIEAGGVTIDGAPARSASQNVSEAAVLTYQPAHPWVGRGALKLDHALSIWPVEVKNRTVLDIGASTGGFTEVCLTRGAAKVYAVDVGQGQLDAGLVNDPRVVNLEQTDARNLTCELVPDAPNLIVCDASFISLSKVLPQALDLAPSGADLISLIKPQFEADSPKSVGKKGIVKDPDAHVAAVKSVRDWLTSLGWVMNEVADSPILGGDGNREFLIWARRG